MGKRSNFERVPRDYYRTFDPRAVAPLLPHVPRGTRFVEPCAGAGDLIQQLESAGRVCTAAFDVAPQGDGIVTRDVLAEPLRPQEVVDSVIITNPVWSRAVLHRMIVAFSDVAPTWLLFDASWLYSIQARVAQLHGVPTVPQLLPRLRKVVAVGRVQWIEGSQHDGKDDCAWYLFDTPRNDAVAMFYGRAA